MEGFLNVFECEDKSGKRPHYRAMFKIDGVEHEAGLWPKEDRNGKTYFTGKFQPKQEREAAGEPEKKSFTEREEERKQAPRKRSK